MKTLYVSDLDGTLLCSNATLSDETRDTINRLIDQGMLFTFATARGHLTSAAVTQGLHLRLPKIIHNGALIADPATGEVLRSNFFGSDAIDLLNDLLSNGIHPIVYSFIDGVQRLSYVKDRCSPGVQRFADERKADLRMRPVNDAQALYLPDTFYFTCIDAPEKLAPLYEKYRDIHHAVFARDIYSGDHWLEIMPKAASKANACLQLKELLGCDRLVVFGDHTNDVDMFQIADESCAMENAVEQLKSIATRVIGKNDDDGVVKWLRTNFERSERA